MHNLANIMKKIFISIAVLATILASFIAVNSNNSINECFEANIEALAQSEHDLDAKIWYVSYREDGGINCTPIGGDPCRRPGEVSTNA